MINLSGKAGVSLIDDSKQSLDRTFSSEHISRIVQGQNILHNWDFRNPVNQRRQLEYTGNVNSIDKWLNGHQTRMSIMDEFIRLERSSGTLAGYVFQNIEHPHLLAGKTLTFSILYRTKYHTKYHLNVPFWFRVDVDNTNLFFEQTPVGGSGIPAADEWSLLSRTVTIPKTLNRLRVGFRRGAETIVGGDYLDIQAVKLELGTMSTLANDLPMDFGRELAACQRYQVLLSLVNGNQKHIRASFRFNNVIYFTIPLPVTLRANPSLVFLNPAEIQVREFPSGTLQTGFTYRAVMDASGMGASIRLEAHKTNHGLQDAVFTSRGLLLDANL